MTAPREAFNARVAIAFRFKGKGEKNTHNHHIHVSSRGTTGVSFVFFGLLVCFSTTSFA